MTTSKKLLGFILMITMIFSLAACGNNNNAQSDEKVLEKMTLGYLNVMDDAQTILAYQAGIYKDHGLDVDMKVFSSGTELIKAM